MSEHAGYHRRAWHNARPSDRDAVIKGMVVRAQANLEEGREHPRAFRRRVSEGVSTQPGSREDVLRGRDEPERGALLAELEKRILTLVARLEPDDLPLT